MNPDWPNWRERDFRRALLKECANSGLIVNYHKVDSYSPVRGWPDLEIVGPKGIIYRELKTMTGDLSTEQRYVGWKVGHAGGHWSIWRPADYASGVVYEELKRIT